VKAAVNTRYGPPDVVHVVEVPTPTPGVGEVLVRVHAATVNRTDCGFRAAKPWIVRPFSGLTKPKATINGSEFAGVVEELGSRVTSFAVGDRVFGFSEERRGAHAEYLAIPEDGPIATIPGDLTFEEAAPSTEGSHYALSIITKTKIRSGQRVLVNGATGAIGSAAVQLLKAQGVTVTATCPGEHVDLVRGLGADRVIDLTAEDFTRDLETYDVVLDAVGKSTFGRCRRLLKPRGIYASTDLGPFAQNPVLGIVTRLLGGRRAMLPLPPRYDQERVRYFRGLLESGALRPVIDRRYPLDRIVEAYRYVETGRKVGNVVISVALPTT
jgi:NADPH:quinone reductase-like Zn-dependent oxidoreductase